MPQGESLVGTKLVDRGQTATDLRSLAGLYYTPDDFVRAVQTNAPALTKVIGAQGVQQLIAWAKAQRNWPSPSKGQTRWGGYGKDPLTIYVEQNLR